MVAGQVYDVHREEVHSCAGSISRINADASKLLQGLEKAVKTTCKELGDEFTDNIYDKYGKQVICHLVDPALTESL